jgi:hypothetical protein
MKNMKKVLTGIAFSAVIALSLLATSADAYARTRPQPNTTVPAPTLGAPAQPGYLNALGVTWE